MPGLNAWCQVEAPPTSKSKSAESGSEQCEASRLRHVSGGAGYPRLRARAADTVGEVRGEVCRTGTAGTERRVQNEVIGAETAGPADVELQVAEVGVTRAVAGRAVDRDAEGHKRGRTAVRRAQAEDPKGVNTARRL
jgi:hypothetical protein